MQCSLKLQPLILVYVREALESLLKQLVNLFKYSRDLVARNCLGIPQRPKFMERKLQFEASIFHIPSYNILIWIKLSFIVLVLLHIYHCSWYYCFLACLNYGVHAIKSFFLQEETIFSIHLNCFF